MQGTGAAVRAPASLFSSGIEGDHHLVGSSCPYSKTLLYRGVSQKPGLGLLAIADWPGGRHMTSAGQLAAVSQEQGSGLGCELWHCAQDTCS